MKVLETKRLLLSTLKEENLDDLMTIWGDPEVMKYCGGAGTKERELRALRFYINLQAEKGYAPYLVQLKETNDVIGVCGFNPPNLDGIPELMYHFAKPYWGLGYATEAASACIDYGWNYLKLPKIAAAIYAENDASKHILSKLNFYYKGEKYLEDHLEYFFELTQGCTFCEIVNRQINAHIIYEDDLTCCFLDINPITKGHVLIIPKEHKKDFTELSDHIILHMMKIIKKIIPVLHQAFQTDGYTIMHNGGVFNEIGHDHFHLIPRMVGDGFSWISEEIESNLEGIRDQISKLLIKY